MSKDELFKISEEHKNMKNRIKQLETHNVLSAKQNLELRILLNQLEDKKRELASAMISHNSFDDLLELCGLKKVAK